MHPKQLRQSYRLFVSAFPPVRSCHGQRLTLASKIYAERLLLTGRTPNSNTALATPARLFSGNGVLPASSTA